MDPSQVALWIMAALLAVLVGVLIPVLTQFRATLKTTQDWVERLGPKVNDTLTETREAVQHANRVGAEVERGTKRVQNMLFAVGDVGQTIQKMNRSFRTAATVGSAVGPAIAAAVKAFMEFGGKPNGAQGTGTAAADCPAPDPPGEETNTASTAQGDPS